MNISIKLNKRVLTAKTKDALVDKIRHNNGYISLTFNKYSNGLILDAGDDIVVYNLEKFRRKTKQKGRKNNLDKRKSVIVRNGEWKAYVYYIPKALLDLGNLKVSQYSRRFELNKKS